MAQEEPLHFDSLRNCWAAEDQGEDLLPVVDWVVQWLHHNLPFSLHPCNQSQARILQMTSAVLLVQDPAHQLVQEPVQQAVEGPARLVVLVLAAVACDNPPLRARFYHNACMRASRMGTFSMCNYTSVAPRLAELLDKVHKMLGAAWQHSEKATKSVRSQNDCRRMHRNSHTTRCTEDMSKKRYSSEARYTSYSR